MARSTITLDLPPDLKARLDRHAADHMLKRSAFARLLIDRALTRLETEQALVRD